MLGIKKLNVNVYSVATIATAVSFVVALLFALFNILAPFVSAETDSNVNGVNDSTNTLKITPVRSDIEVKPGESKIIQTTVTNMTNSAITVRPTTNDFIAGDEWGTPALILDDQEYAPTHSLKRFMSELSDITIEAKGAETVDVVISVPEDAQAGGYFGAVRFEPTSPEEGGQVNMITSAASLVLLTVPGDLIERLDLTSFDITQDGKGGSIFGSSNNIQANIKFQNKGNVQVGPTGKISVKKGDSIVYEADFNGNDPRDMILPDTSRRWEMPLNKIGSFGKYTVEASFAYGAKNEAVNISKSFWVIPTMVIVITVVGVLVIIGLIVGLWLILKGRNRRVYK